MKDEKKKMVTIIDTLRTQADKCRTTEGDEISARTVATMDPKEILRSNQELANYVSSLLKKIKGLERNVSALTNENKNLNDNKSQAETSIKSLDQFLNHNKL